MLRCKKTSILDLLTVGRYRRTDIPPFYDAYCILCGPCNDVRTSAIGIGRALRNMHRSLSLLLFWPKFCAFTYFVKCCLSEFHSWIYGYICMTGWPAQRVARWSCKEMVVDLIDFSSDGCCLYIQ